MLVNAHDFPGPAMFQGICFMLVGVFALYLYLSGLMKKKKPNTISYDDVDTGHANRLFNLRLNAAIERENQLRDEADLANITALKYEEWCRIENLSDCGQETLRAIYG